MSSEVKPTPAPFVAPTTRDGWKQFFGEVIAELFSIPRNANLLAKALVGAQHNALLAAIDTTYRQEIKPVVVRTEYPDSWRCTVKEGEGAGTLEVIIEERADGNGDWIMCEGSDVLIAKATGLVLSQSAQPGDIFYLTTSNKIEEARDAFVDQYLSEAHEQVDERAAVAEADAAQANAQ